MSDTILRVKNLQTWLGSDRKPVRVVDGIDLDISKGETFALVGESGCGKSMSALSLMRLLPPVGRIVGGSAHLDGTDLLRLSEKAMRGVRGGRMGMIFQEPMTSLNPVMKIGEQIAEAVRVHDDLSRRDIHGRVVELLDAVGIPDPGRRAHEYPHQLSGGMKQRVMIAMALAGRPELLIADEPTTALDVTIQSQVLQLLRKLQDTTNMAVFLITHDLGVVAETADRIAVMYAGQIVECAGCVDFFSSPRHPYSRKLFESLPDESKRTSRLAVIPGSVPPLDSRFTGCRFAERCEMASEICRREEPLWSRVGEWSVRCHLYDGSEDTARGTCERTFVPRVAGATADQPLLRVHELKVHFPIRKGVLRRVVGQVHAVDGVSFAVPRGRTLALVGESGCGKTTVGKSILQLIRPTAGRVMFESLDLTTLKGKALRQKRADLQIIFQDPVASMNPRMLVGDIIEEGIRAQGIGGDRKERAARVAQLLDHVGLPSDAARRYPHEFSGGQRQRICVARSLAVDPKLIVCDEPTSALDVSVQAQILNLLEDLQNELGLSYLFITHDISVVAYVAHEVAVMYLGRIVEHGTVDEVLGSPQHPYTQALLSAVPVADPRQKKPVVRLEGDIPSPINPPSGCYFHPRCPHAADVCHGTYPEPVRLSESRTVSCIRVAADD